MSAISISVACADAGCEKECVFSLAEPATLADALAAAKSDAGFAQAIEQAAAFGVWGKVKPLTQALREGDRVEIYRPLRADPKDARRNRATGGARR